MSVSAAIANPTIAPQKIELLTVNGGSDGVLTVIDTGGFYAGAQAFLSDNTPDSRLCQITQIISPTELKIKFLNENGIAAPYGTGIDASAFLTANAATLTMPSQLVYALENTALVTSAKELKVDIGGAPSFSTGQGDPNTVDNAWPILITDGVETASVNGSGQLEVNMTGIATEATLATLASETTLSAINDKLRVYDLDNTGAVANILGVTIRTLSNGEPVQHGTVADPFRVDPTGDTTQPVEITAATSTSAPAAVTVSNSATLIIAANSNRKKVVITNNGTSNIYLGNDNTVTASGATMGLKIAPNGVYEDSGAGLSKDDIYGIGDAASAVQNVSVQERE